MARAQATRRSRVVAPDATPVQPVDRVEEVATASAAPTEARRTEAAPRRAASTAAPAVERIAGRAEPATLRAVSRSVASVARDERGAEVVAAEPTRYVRESTDPLQPRTETGAERRMERPTRRLRASVPDAVLPETELPSSDVETPTVAARTPAARAASTDKVAAPVAGAAAHAVRRAVHAAVESRPVSSVERAATRAAAEPASPTARRAVQPTPARPQAAQAPSVARVTRRQARRTLMPRAVAPITLSIPTFGDAQPEMAPTRRSARADVRATAVPRLQAAPAVNVDAVVDRVATAIRAALRGEEPTVVLDAARRTLRVRTELADNGPLERAGDRLGTPAPRPVRFAPQAPELSLAEAPEIAAVEGDVQTPRTAASAPAARTARAATTGSRPGSSSPATRILGRQAPGGQPVPRWTRVRADGTVVRVPSEARVEARSQGQARAQRVAARADLLRTGPGFGAPDLGSLPQPMAAAAVEGETPRPLARTLGQLDPESAPLPGSSASPGWAQRAVHGTAATSREQLRATKALRQDSGLFTALARSSTPDEVIRVILERGDSASSIRQELGAPAAAMVERIVRMRREVADTEQVLRPGRSESDRPVSADAAEDVMAAAPLPGQTRRARSVRGVPSSFLSSAATRDGVGASNVMKLAGKLQRLIHLAESERRLREAQAQVRMSTESVSEGTAAAGPNANTEDETPDIGALQRDVLHAVMTELELLRIRRQEDPDGPSRW
ncbi:MAG: hypothetical protein EP330_07765 [Deltaproteobacteria bacterium]|nr:MAG: hypothetical protein EP330_07765 [Deltaproteobacteria bacterium]